MTANRHRGSTLDSFLEEYGITRIRPTVRSTRRGLKPASLPVEAPRANEADFDPDLDKLMD